MSDITIIMPSYNKESLIAEALNSVFMQETTYNYQIIIADDCSSDRTVEIAKAYQDKYPNKITILTSDKNQKLYKNVLRAYEITKTDYFCVLDPDDYWTDKFKIQKALDFLENNRDFTIYATNTMVANLDGTKEKYLKHDKSIDSSFESFLQGKSILGHTLGSIFRNVVFKNGIPDKMKNLVSNSAENSFRGDTFRTVLHLYYGKSHFVPECDAIYRITESGIWQGTNQLDQHIMNANIFKDLWLFFDKKHIELLNTSNYFFELAKRDIIEELNEIQDSNKLKITVEKLADLSHFYKENFPVNKQSTIQKLDYLLREKLLKCFKKLT